MEKLVNICGHELYIMRTATNKDGATEHAYRLQLNNGFIYYGSFTDTPKNSDELNSTLWEVAMMTSAPHGMNTWAVKYCLKIYGRHCHERKKVFQKASSHHE